MGYIYMLTSPKGKTYIGQTTRPIHKRLQEHETGQSKDCRAIYNAIKFHGWENFEKDYYECPDDDLNKHEELMVEVLGTMAPSGYNLREGGGSHGKLSEETKQKMSESTKSYKNPNYGKIGEKNHLWGVQRSEETRQKISEGLRGEKHYFFGKTHTEEHKQKNREAQLGKTHTVEAKQKMSDAQRGEKNHMFGKSPSEETKQKMSEARLGEKNHNSKRVYQYALDGTFINSFCSTGEAGRHLEKDGSKIRQCARGESKTAYKFKWSYTLE